MYIAFKFVITQWEMEMLFLRKEKLSNYILIIILLEIKSNNVY